MIQIKNQLAYGTINAATINAGSQNQLTITMDMNAQYIVLTTDPVGGADATVLSTNLESPTQFCSYGTGPQPFYAFAADPTAGYVLPVLTGTPAGAAYDVNNAGIAIPAPTFERSFLTARCNAARHAVPLHNEPVLSICVVR